MKNLFCVLAMVLSTNIVYAKGAVGALSKIIPAGIHRGVTLSGDCLVDVHEVNFPRLAFNVTIQDGANSMSKLIDDEAVFAQKSGAKAFFQSDRTSIDDRGDYSEKYLRTSMNNDGTLHVVVGEVIVVEEKFDDKVVECNLSL